jgi:pimeloyl-ACP methyl ester carboxylesterase
MTTAVSIDGLTISHDILGAEDAQQTVILLHGWGRSLKDMHSLGAALAERGDRVHLLDMPGFGDSPLPPDAWGVADYARLVAHYLDATCSTKVRLIGHSFGGRISIVLGADYPDKIDKIVLTASAGVLPPRSARDVVIGIGKQIMQLPGLSVFERQMRDWAKRQFGSADYKAAGALELTFRKVIAEDLVPFAGRIKAPTLLIWGDADVDTPLSQARVLEKTIPDAGLVVFQGATHFAYQERLLEFVRIVDTFFTQP